MNRKVLLGVLVGLAVWGALLRVVHAMVTPKSRITEETCHAIRAGMTQQELEDLLGGPPGDYTSGEMGLRMRCRLGSLRHNHRTEVWEGDDGAITVLFDNYEGNKVFSAEFSHSLRPNTSLPNKIITSIKAFLGQSDETP